MLTAIAINRGNIIRIRPAPPPPPSMPVGILVQAKAVMGKGRKSILLLLPEPVSASYLPSSGELSQRSAARPLAVGECAWTLDSVRLCPPVLLGRPPRTAVVTGEVRIERERAMPGDVTKVYGLSLPFSAFIDIAPIAPQLTSSERVTFTGEWEAEIQTKAELAQGPVGGNPKAPAVMLHMSVTVTETCLMRILCKR